VEQAEHAGGSLHPQDDRPYGVGPHRSMAGEEGERVEQHQAIMEVETDKAVSELESPASGILKVYLRPHLSSNQNPNQKSPGRAFSIVTVPFKKK